MYTKTLGALMTVAGLALASQAQATLMLTLEDSATLTSITVTDGGMGDSNPLAGAITFIGPVGGWSLNVTTALGSDALSVGHVDLNSVNMNGPASTLTMILEEDNLSAAGVGLANIRNVIGGTLGKNGLLTSTALVDGMAVAGTALSFDNLAGSSSIGFSGDASGQALIGDPFSLAIEVVLRHDAANATTSFDNEVTIAEPASLGLLGLGLVGLGLAARRRKTA